MNIIDFCDKHNIKWFPINLKIDDNKKKMINMKEEHYKYYEKTMADVNDYETLSIEELKNRQSIINDYEYIAMDTSEIFQIDVDAEGYDEKLIDYKNMPYYLSLTKGLKHIFVKDNSGVDFIGKRKPLIKHNSKTDIELLCGQMSWCKKDMKINNYNNNMLCNIYKGFNMTFNKPKEIKKKIENIPEELQQKIYNTNNKEIIELINIINPNRADDYDSWYKIVGALKTENLKDIAREFSKKSSKYNAHEFETFYNSQIAMSLGVIYNIAKEDNKEKYGDIVYNKTKLSKLLEDTELADIYLENNNDVFYHPSNRYNCCFVYNERLNIWSEVDKENKLNYYIKVDLDKKFKNYINYLEIKNSKLICKDVDCKEKCEICIKRLKITADIVNTRKNLRESKKQGTLNQIASSCNDTLRAHPKNIEMDINPYLFCWDNKTYDIKNKKFYNRTKTDYITHTCGYDYIESDIMDNEINNFISEILPNKDVRESYISILRSGLTSNRPQKFTCANGSGRNGKGVTTKIMSKLLGNYFYSAPASIITEKWSGNKASPEIANITNKRLCVIAEPEDNEDAIATNIKKMTGEDILAVRKLYSNKTESRNDATYIMECNVRLKIKGDVTNESMLQRYIDIYFNQTFTKNKEDLKKPNYREAKMEYSGDNFAEKMRIAFFHYLVNNGKEEIYEPEIVKERSIKYLNSCEGVTTYFEENYEETKNNKDIVKLNDIYNSYKLTDDYINMEKKMKSKVNIKYIYDLMSKKYNVLSRKKIEGKDYKNIIIGYKEIEDIDE